MIFFLKWIDFYFSDLSRFPSFSPYFHVSNPMSGLVHQRHLIVCVHGLDGNSADLRLVKTYMEMALPGNNLDFLMSEVNQVLSLKKFVANKSAVLQ